MKRNTLEKWLLFGLLIVSALVGAYAAAIVIQDNRYVPEGILGVSVIVLLYRELTSPINTLPFQQLFAFPKFWKHLVTVLIGTMVVFWALREIIEMIFFIINKLRTY